MIGLGSDKNTPYDISLNYIIVLDVNGHLVRKYVFLEHVNILCNVHLLLWRHKHLQKVIFSEEATSIFADPCLHFVRAINLAE